MDQHIWKKAVSICGCALEDCPIDGSLLAKLQWVRKNNMGKGTDGEIDARKLDALIASLISPRITS